MSCIHDGQHLHLLTTFIYLIFFDPHSVGGGSNSRCPFIQLLRLREVKKAPKFTQGLRKSGLGQEWASSSVQFPERGQAALVGI